MVWCCSSTIDEAGSSTLLGYNAEARDLAQATTHNLVTSQRDRE